MIQSTTLPPLNEDRLRASWLAADLERNKQWIYSFGEEERDDLRKGLEIGFVPGKPLLEYRRSDFPFGRSLDRIAVAMNEVQHGLGVALIKGLPREGLSEAQFEILTWAIGLHFGVARPQDKASRYINQVRDVGVNYRSATGRGYSSNAELDFHVDGCDVVFLSCYNQAPEGGDSMCSSSMAAYRQMLLERPDLVSVLYEPLPFGLQGEQADGLPAFVPLPVFGERDGKVFCMWARNRVIHGEKLPGAPRVTDAQREAMDLLDEIVRRSEFMYSMRLEPGDIQILSNHTALHSRTAFHDAEEPEKKRTLYRLWLSTPDAPALPTAWGAFYGPTEPGMVRGGAYGQNYTEVCRRFDESQAATMGMRLAA